MIAPPEINGLFFLACAGCTIEQYRCQSVMWGRTYVRRRRARDVRRATERAQRAAEVATVSG